MNRRVFVSSTIYDLIDLRAEVEAHLRSCGLVPVLSDRPGEDFRTNGTEDSIELCLANLRTCVAYVGILSSRYGRRIGRGYADQSATEIEYREARLLNIPIHMFVRDRLEADFAAWKRRGRPTTPAGGPAASAVVAAPTETGAGVEVASEGPPRVEVSSFPWVSSPKDFGLFDLLDDHQQLAKDRANWYSVFRDSVELKGQLSAIFAADISKGRLERLRDEGKLPLFDLAFSGWGQRPPANHWSVVIKVLSCNQVLAREVQLALDGQGSKAVVGTVVAEGSGQARLDFGSLDANAPFDEVLRLSYSIAAGDRISDFVRITKTAEPGTGLLLRLVAKRIDGGPDYRILGPDEQP